MDIATYYEPDNWVIVRIHEKSGETLGWKVLGGTSGGYADADYWRVNSGIKDYTEEDEHYLFHGYSGSTYKCRKMGETIRMNIAGTLRTMTDSGMASIQDFKDFKESYNYSNQSKATERKI